ncbi:MAG TPA: hypothetical protein PK282_00785 [Rhodoglobus sp.]|nr:hypothetical protein [Rhodoglobus sp.]HPM50744.1 hypothetical protein [Rhodoglobus sp.]
MLRGIAVGITGVLLSLAGAVVMSSGTGCTAQPVDVDKVATLDTSIAGYTGDQLVNAAIIMNVATAQGLGQQAQIIGVTAAIAQSGLRNSASTGSAELGLFAQSEAWGTAEQRLVPARAALLFYAQLQRMEDWQTTTPSIVAVQVTGDGTADFAGALKPATDIVSALTPTDRPQCQVSGNAQALALELVTHIDDGTLTGLGRPPLDQIRWIAEGKNVPDCGIDIRILQIIVIATRHFDKVGISDINRKCTGSLLGAGINSAHYADGGGHAVDFYSLDGRPVTGADGLSIRLIGLLEPVVPDSSRVGQSDCRAAAGVPLALTHFGQIEDDCHHLHVDVRYASGSLQLP